MDIYNVKYRLRKDYFLDLLKKNNYSSCTDFCRKNSIHKNTLYYYLSGRDVFAKKLYELARALDVDPLKLIEPVDKRVLDSAEIKPIVEQLCLTKKIAVCLMGSRAKGTHKQYSDWDIGITGGAEPLTGREFIRLRGQAMELADDLPRSIDLINLDAAPHWFLESIDYQPVFLKGNKNAYFYFLGVLNGIRQCKTDSGT
jgi:predicted nucleotidyltransferase